MQIAIYVNQDTTLLFSNPAAGVKLQRLGGDTTALARAISVTRGVYRIETIDRITPEADPNINVFVDEDMSTTNIKDPFPPDPGVLLLELIGPSTEEATKTLRLFFTGAKAGPAIASGEVSISPRS